MAAAETIKSNQLPDQATTPFLTIVIPTFNRPEKVSRLVTQCLSQMDERTSLLVLDNASDRDVRELLKPIASEGAIRNFRVLRHPVNIGAVANVLRCFEVPETPWIWIIGDDDGLEEGALETVLESIHANQDAININFAGSMFRHVTGVDRTISARYKSFDELIDGVDCFSNYVFISTNIYNRAKLLPYLRLMYNSPPTFLPHLAMVMAALKDDIGVVCALPAAIACWGKPDDALHKWDGNVVYRDEHNILYLADDEASRVGLAAFFKGIDYPGLGYRDYFIRLAFDQSADKSSLRDELLRSMAMKGLISGSRKGLFIGGLALAFEPVIVMATYVFRRLKHGFKGSKLPFTKRPSRFVEHPRL